MPNAKPDLKKLWNEYGDNHAPDEILEGLAYGVALEALVCRVLECLSDDEIFPKQHAGCLHDIMSTINPDGYVVSN